MAHADRRPEPMVLPRERLDAFPRQATAQAEWRLFPALQSVSAEWRDLTTRALEPNVFYDPSFARAAAPVFGVNAGAVLVRRAGRLIGLFPARIERRYGVMVTLTGWTHPYAPLGVPLVDRDEAAHAIAAWLDLIETGGRRLVMLPLLPREGAFAMTLRRVLSRRGGAAAEFGVHARALLAPAQPQDRADYLQRSISPRKLKDLRRQRRRLAEAGAVTFVSAQDGADIAAALEAFLSLEASGWKAVAGSAARAHPAIRIFMERALAALAAEGHARIDRLMQADRTLAAAIVLRSGDTSWFWKIAYDEAHARASPGVQLSLDLTTALLDDASVARADSCATADHPMIDHIWRERLTMCDLLITPAPDLFSAFQIARGLESLRRTTLGAAKHLRDTLRG